jgi:hypothetical protein
MNVPVIGHEDIYSSTPQRLGVKAVTNGRTANITQFAKPLSLKMAVLDRAQVQHKQTDLYFSDANSGGWESLNGSLSTVSNNITGSTLHSGAFAGITKPQPGPKDDGAADEYRDAMLRVTAALNIKDLGTYRPNEALTADGFNNIVNAFVKNKKTVTMNATLSDADKKSLTKSKLYVESPGRGAAVSALVTLYELKTKRAVKPSSTLERTPVAGIRNAGADYQKNLLKAAEIGFIDESFSPNGTLTMGEFMAMLDIIIQDS